MDQQSTKKIRATPAADALTATFEQIQSLVLGKPHEIKLALACLLAGGHLLIEDLPGVGKTTLANAIALSIGGLYSRLQFTSDMLPSDVIGVSVYQQSGGEFRFHPGPVFCNVLLADEINRANPKTQSALLEAMAENQISVDRSCHALPSPFFVVATQNPADFAGTFPLPDSQLDRFLLRISLGYPNQEAERELLESGSRQGMLSELSATISTEQLMLVQAQVEAVHCAPPVIDYLQAILAYSRESRHFVTGLSPRAGLALLRCARAWALLDGRDYCLPEDIQAILPGVCSHRLRIARDSQSVIEDSGRYIIEHVSLG